MQSVSHSSTSPRTDGTASSAASEEAATVPATSVYKETSEHDTPFRPLCCSTPVATPKPVQPIAATSAATTSPTHATAAGRGGDARWAAYTQTIAESPVAATSVIVRELHMGIEDAKSAFVSEAGAARAEALHTSIVLDEEAQWQGKERDWEDKYSKLEQILVQQQREADEAARQAAADIDGLSAAIECNLVAIESGFPPGIFGGTPAAPVAAPFFAPLPPAPALADKLAELTMLKKQLDALKMENKRMHDQYDSLHDIYSTQRQAIEHLQAENEETKGSLTAANARYASLRQHAETKLDEASEEVEALRASMVLMEKQHESDTLAVRMRLRQRDSDVELLEQNLEAKKKQVVELKKICHELILKAGEADE
ncbi:tac-1 [Pristionchus pacificus]|uniref:TACC_C domain-containing protein n=1 Tax=Pristionchus pacificus TaxID=54126 RepID=A0A2A6C8T8_PRIPA|nr:tac-1 [Pristionchus pacificus]|eukprot:PDM74527.1 hypothetical protein PRIPAC_41883 [Pristionchus pacificus]